MDEDFFDESTLFSTFDFMENGDKNLHKSESELDSLKRENLLLKRLVRQIICNPSKDEPFANVMFYKGSARDKQVAIEDFLLWFYAQSRPDVIASGSSGQRKNLVSDGFAAALGRVTDYAKLDQGKLDYDMSDLPMGSIQYFSLYCLDRFGSNFEKTFPTPPTYDCVYSKTLPIDGSKVSRRHKAICFNCDGDHKLQHCPKQRDLARISAKRKEFMGARSESRYHEDQAKVEQFEHLKPGQTSDQLREALGMVKHDLPPFVYRMRMLGYPPGWLPSNEASGIVMYGKEGKEEDKKLSCHLDPGKYVHFPGFNVPIPRECKDLAYEVRLPVMRQEDQLHIKDDLLEEGKRKLPSDCLPYHDNKKARTCSESDMDVEIDPEASSSFIEMTEQPNYTERNGPYVRAELEDGEIADSPREGELERTEQSWWLTEPLVTNFKKNNDQEFVPPPFPLRPLPLHKISQILPGELNHISAEDRSRWLDPIFGNLQVRTGRYDKLKVILGARENKRKSL